MSLARLETAQVQDQRLLVRLDFDGMLDKAGKVTDAFRVEAILPTLELLRQRGAALLLLGHAGDATRPAPFETLAQELSKRLNTEVRALTDLAGETSRSAVQGLAAGEVLLLPNLALFEGERKNDKQFASQLAALGDGFVNEAFGTSRSTVASLSGLAARLPSWAGLNLFREVEMATLLASRESRPLSFLLGGVQLGNRIALLRQYLERLSTVMIGGGIAYTFLKSRAVPVGASLVERELEVPAFQTIERAELAEAELILPVDHLVADGLTAKGKTKIVSQSGIPDGWMGVDVGPKSIARFEKTLKAAATVLWYGPLGMLEMDRFAKGTEAIAKSLSKHRGRVIVAGADTVRAVHQMGLADRFTHLSTDGRSLLDLMMGQRLAALTALESAQK